MAVSGLTRMQKRWRLWQLLRQHFRQELVRPGRHELEPFLSKKKHALNLNYKPGEGVYADQLVGLLEQAQQASIAVSRAARRSREGEDVDLDVGLAASNCSDEPVLCETMLVDGGGLATPRFSLPVTKYNHFLDRTHQCDGRLQMGDVTRFVTSRMAAGGGGAGGGQDSNPDSAAHWADVEHREYVVLLNDATFDEVLGRSQLVLVFFYAPWCMHCSNVKQTYATAAHQLAKEGHEGCLAAVDFSFNPLVEKRFRLEFLPAFKLFNTGKFVSDHHKLRTIEEFTQLITKGENEIKH